MSDFERNFSLGVYQSGEYNNYSVSLIFFFHFLSTFIYTVTIRGGGGDITVSLSMMYL